MDFFDHQDTARKKTKLLVFYFVIAVACIIGSVYLAALLIFNGTQSQTSPGSVAPELVLWDPRLFLYAILGTLLVVVVGSLYKTATLAKGGSAVAELLGGRLVNPNTTHPDERRLRNVVEEMAIASGVPVPKIYLLEDEEGINAFAAGHSTSDAAIGVTRGCMTMLNRDELQGVIGHEFSHILNGDMRLNLRIMGVVFGILCLTVIGRILLYSRSRSSKDKNPLMLMGLALLIIGGIGVFFGRLIQAALSRQREFLADASSIQFTRNPAGLSGALQKIGAAGSRIESAHAEEAGHMFFENGLSKPFLGLLATHPPLEERIHAIDPGWDGKFKPVSTLAVTAEAPRGAGKPALSRFPFPGMPGMGGAVMVGAGLAPNQVQVGTVLPSLGSPTPQHLRYAVDLRNSFSEKVQAASREPLEATALMYAMLLSRDPTLRATQLVGLGGRAALGVRDTVARLWPEVAPAAARARLPLVNLALPALRQLRPDEIEQFMLALQWLIESDQQIDLFEFVLQKIIRRHLAPQLGQTRSTSGRFQTITPLLSDCVVVLSALAHVGSSKADEVERAFQTGLPYLRAESDGMRLLPDGECGFEMIDRALDRLSLAAPKIKKSLIEACVHVVGADGLLEEREAELLRAIADTLDCPISPFVQIVEA